MHPLETAWHSITREFEAARAEAAEASRVQATNDLNQIARRLKQYQSEAEWVDAVLDGASLFVGPVALFTVENGSVRARGSRKFELPDGSSFPLEAAAAFRNALDSKETAVVLRTRNEVSDLLASDPPTERAYLVPVSNGLRIAAVLFAPAHNRIDLNALELIATISSAVLERHSQTPAHIQIAPAPAESTAGKSDTVPETEEAPKRAASLPPWATLPAEEKNLHIRAQRFARVKVAEMQLYKPEACRAGRDQNNLYVFLKNEIDNAREQFRTQFMANRNMVDYLHLELVRTLAANDELFLGADYPGQMV
jgi:hypothetical protein